MEEKCRVAHVFQVLEVQVDALADDALVAGFGRAD